MFYFILFSLCLFQVFNFKIQFPHFSISFFYVFNFKLTISQFQNSNCYKFQNSNIPISNFKFLNLKSQIYKIQVFNFKYLISKSQFKILKLQIHFKFLISKISNFQLQNFNFKSIFKNFKHMINSIVPIKWDLVDLICVIYKWAWVGPDISCILLTNNLISNL